MEEIFSKDHFVEVLEALHRDQTGLAAAMVRVGKLVDGWHWATEGRGSYEWDDSQYRKEFGRCLETISVEVKMALQASSSAHQICCERYGHVRQSPKEPVQMEFRFYEDFDSVVDRLRKFSTIEGEAN